MCVWGESIKREINSAMSYNSQTKTAPGQSLPLSENLGRKKAEKGLKPRLEYIFITQSSMLDVVLGKGFIEMGCCCWFCLWIDRLVCFSVGINREAQVLRLSFSCYVSLNTYYFGM